jgi:hypothetical protein
MTSITDQPAILRIGDIICMCGHSTFIFDELACMYFSLVLNKNFFYFGVVLCCSNICAIHQTQKY